MKRIINTIFISLLLIATGSYAQHAEKSVSQSNIIRDTHSEHGLASGTGSHKNTPEPEIQQGNLLKVIQKEHDVSYEKRPGEDQTTASSAPGGPLVKDKPKGPVKAKPEKRHQRMIADAWKRYGAGRYQEAADLFSKVIDQTRDHGVTLEAYYGLGHSLKRLGRDGEAQGIFESLVKQDFKLTETAPLLMELLVISHDWPAAKRYLDKLPEDQRVLWSQKIEEGLFDDEYKAAIEEKDTGAIVMLVNNYRHFLAECRKTGTFLEAAAVMAGAGGTEKAGMLYEELLKCGQEDWTFRMQVHHEMEKNLPVEVSLAFVEKEMEKGRRWGREYSEPLSELRMRLLKKRFLAADRMSAEYLETGAIILDINPADKDVRSALAWGCFNGKDYQCALKHFEILRLDNPGNRDYLKGMIYSLINTGDRDKALSTLEKFAGVPDDETSTLRHDLYSMTGEHKYKENNYSRAEYYLVKALEIKPHDHNDRTLLAWTYYRQQKYDRAVKLFKEVYLADKSEETAANLMLAFEKLNGDEQAKILSELKGGQEPVLQKMAADRNYKNNAPMTASYIYDGEGTCYRNCNSPLLELSGYYRNKSGDRGLSRLIEFSFPIRFHYPVRAGKEWVFSITPVYLDSGNTPSAVYAGRYFRYIHDNRAEQRPLTDSVMVYEPEIRYRTEGPVEKEFMLGTTPINGHAEPLPRFMGKITGKDRWSIQLHQDLVRESILSYTGLKDPYGDKEWGRVLKTGARAGMTFALSSPYWVSLDTGYDYYWGGNVVQNYSVYGNISTGRTDRIFKGESNAGLFITSRHFDKNTAFFTFGHGGYFSPDMFFIAGPFIRYKTEACKDFLFDGEISAGYMYFRTEDAPHYYKIEDDAALLNAAAQNDLSGEYEGEKKSTLGLNLKLKAVKLIHDNIGVGAYLQGNNSADFNEFSIGLVIQYYFEPLKTISHTWDVFQGM